MATKKPLPKLSFAERVEPFLAQFRNLDANDPSVWPAIPRYLLCATVVAFVIGACWYVWLSDSDAALEAERAKEMVLRDEYKKKVAKVVNLDALKKQREQVLQYVTQLEKQLPSKAEMDALLSDINQAGIGRNLQFDLFRPGQVAVQEYYAQLPISVRVVGRYHDIGAFVADVANLSRIVTMSNLSIVPAKDGSLAMDGTANTFRYLDADEIAAKKPGGAKK
jgi:type IV pilus assembly protein PilO